MTQSNIVQEKITRLNGELKHYTVSLSNRALGEDGRYAEADTPVGYAVVNNETGVVEHTTTILPAVIFQAQHLDDMLASLVAVEPEGMDETTLDALSVDDVVPN